jgi:hypothetical protein
LLLTLLYNWTLAALSQVLNADSSAHPLPRGGTDLTAHYEWSIEITDNEK